MRSFIPAYEMRAPESLAQALDLLASEPGVWQAFAGGTDLMVLLEAGKLEHRRFLSIWNLPELRGINVGNDFVTFGALTTYSEVLASEILQREFPLLIEAARTTGGIATQNRGTLGGNIVNASPAADTPPALLVYEAELELISARGSRWLPHHQFHIGYRQTRLQPDELLVRIRLARDTSRWRQYYRKVGTRRAQAISKICLAALLDSETGDARVAVGSVAPVPLRCFRTEGAIRDHSDVLGTLAGEISPIDDMRSTAAYRTRIAQNLLQDFLNGR
ncbi:MAG TPA: FAD binding domain-containing protein [Terriglobales bacterium]|nr:FAD binding domain-containing protein [Terriglobales bacterium]